MAPLLRNPVRLDLRHLHDLTRKLEGRERAFLDWLEYVPAVVWCKDYSDGGRVVFISKEYAKLWPSRSYNYVGAFDESNWPPEIAAQFRRNDLEVLARKELIETIEDTPGAIDPGWNRIRVIKFPIWSSDHHNAGPTMVGGIGLKLGDHDDPAKTG